MRIKEDVICIVIQLLEKYRNQITWADKIVFVYPIWWGRPPAMLMGYIDQLFAANFAYRDKRDCYQMVY